MRIRKSMTTLLLLVAVAVLTSGAGVVVSFSQKQDAKTKQQEREERRKKLEQYTRSIYRGTLDPAKEKIPDLLAKSERDLGQEVEIGLPTLEPFKRAKTLQEILNERTCDVAAVVVGVVKSQTPRLTEDETDIYTINELEVTSVLKDNVAQPIKPGDHINALRQGGRIEIKGRKFKALYHWSLWLEMDRTYLLYLSFVPEKGFYVTTGISHELKNNKIVLLNEGYREKDIQTGSDASSYIESVRAAVAAPCDD